MHKKQYANQEKNKLTTGEREAQRILREFRLIAFLAIIVLSIGMVFYQIVEDLTWVDAFYFSVISFTTVGYGDISPQTNAGKLFTAIYLIIGIAIFGAFINNLIKSRLAKRTLNERNR